MRSSRTFTSIAIVLATSAASSLSRAQQPAQGFAVERFYPSAPEGGWLVMDGLSVRGGLGGAMALTMGYARDPLQVGSGSQRLAVVSDEAFTDFGFAVTYDRWRLSLNMDMPLVIDGQSGTVGSTPFSAPSVDPGSHPDTLMDPRIGIDGRLVGDATSPFRLGASVQLFVPNGSTADYDTDGTFRAMGRVLFAGEVGSFTWAGQVGAHLRPRDDSPIPGAPRGSELLFGLAIGPRLVLGDAPDAARLVVGPEVFGETAVRYLFSTDATGVEGLLSARVEQPRSNGSRIRLELGAGGGLDPSFGAPEWRIVGGIELSGEAAPVR